MSRPFDVAFGCPAHAPLEPSAPANDAWCLSSGWRRGMSACAAIVIAIRIWSDHMKFIQFRKAREAGRLVLRSPDRLHKVIPGRTTPATSWDIVRRAHVAKRWSRRVRVCKGPPAFTPDDGGHGVDQRQMGERLGEVAQVSTAVRIDLFGIQLKGRRIREKLLAQRAGTIEFTDRTQCRDEPKRAYGEGPFLACEAVLR